MNLGKLESYWITSTLKTNYPSLEKNIQTDVVVIGGGIVGITTALMLKEHGLRVVLIESGRIVQAVTGNTTAKVTSLHNLIYDYLVSSFGKEKAQLYANANQSAIDKIEGLVDRYKIDADFKRVPSYIIADDEKEKENIKKEVEAAEKLNLPVSYIDNPKFSFKTFGAVRFANQARFHPRKYLLPLAEKINNTGSFVFENTRALKIENGLVLTEKAKIKNKYIVVATHTPFFKTPGLFFSRTFQSQSYGLAINLKRIFPDEMYLTVGKSNNHTFRLQPSDDGMIFIGGGSSHKVGQNKNYNEIYESQAEFYNKHYGVKEVLNRWSTQDVHTLDRIPYIGRISKNIYIATGFGKWGMTQGTVAAMLITDLILGKKNEWESLYDPNRLDIANSAGNFVKGMGNVVGQYVKGKIKREEELNVDELGLGEAKIGTVNGREIGVYRDEKGKVHAVSPFCTFEGCKVVWNKEDKTWDCPCCGSRYTFDGKVINGPATVDLEQISV